MSMAEKPDIGGTLLFIIFAAVGLLLLIFFLSLILAVLKAIGLVVCLIVGAAFFIFLLLGAVHLVLIPYYALKKGSNEQPIYEGTYRIEDADEAGNDNGKGGL